jgi:hypothetical protein
MALRKALSNCLHGDALLWSINVQGNLVLLPTTGPFD